MADNQVTIYTSFSMKDPSKNKKMCSWIVKNCWRKKPLPELDTSKMLDWDSKLLNKLLSRTTSIKNALSPATFPSEEKFSRVLSFQPKCKEPSSSEEIICTTSPNITDMRKDTETSQCTAPPLSQSKKEISWWSDNAGHCVKQCISTCWKWSPTK